MDDIVAYLRRKGFDPQVVGQEARLNCPFCGDAERKFSVNLATGLWRCWHANRCGKQGNFWQLQRELGDEPRAAKAHKEYVRPKPAKVQPGRSEYLVSRGISPEVAERYGAGELPNGVVVFAYMKDGALVNNKYRSVRDKKMWQEKDAEPCLYGRDLIGVGWRELLVVEGEIDCLTMAQAGMPNVVSVPGGASNLAWIECEWEWLEQFEAVLLGFDADDAGEEGAEKAAQRLGRWRCRRVRWPRKDPNDCWREGLTAAELKEVVAAAEDMRPPTVKPIEELLPRILTAERKGVPCGIAKLDDLMGGLRSQEVTVWTGRNGDGKTTLLNQVTLHLLGSDCRVCFASLEMRPEWVGRWMLYQAGCPTTPEGAEAFRRLARGRLIMLDTRGDVTPEELLATFEYVERRHGSQHFIVDSLLRVNLGGNRYGEWLDNQRAFVNALAEFAIAWDVHVHLVAHPRKGERDGERVDKVDVAGSYDITNLASNVVAIRRLKENGEGPRAELSLLKCRETGRVGSFKMAFDRERRRYVELDQPDLEDRVQQRVVGQNDDYTLF